MDKFGEKLKLARKRAGYKTAKDFVTQHNLSPATYYLHESGRCIPRMETIQLYSQLLNTDLHELIVNKQKPLKENRQNHPKENFDALLKKDVIMSLSTFGISKSKFEAPQDDESEEIIQTKILEQISDEFSEVLQKLDYDINPKKISVDCVKITQKILHLSEKNENISQKLIRVAILGLEKGLTYNE